MGIKLIAREWKAGSVECRNEYLCDTDADLENLPQAPVGSRAISLWSKKERAVNTKGIWKPYGENFVGSPILDLVEVEQEAEKLEYGKEVKFKKVITAEDCQAYIAKAGQPETVAGADTYYLGCRYFLMVYNMGGTVAYYLHWEDPSAPLYAIGMQALNPTMPADGWWLVSSATGEYTQAETPTVIFEEGIKMSADLEATSVFFDLGGGSGGGGLVEGETYTLKNDLSGVDPSNFMKTPDPKMSGIYRIALLNTEEAGGLAYWSQEMVAQVSSGAVSGAWNFSVGSNPATAKMYLYPIKINDAETGEIIDNNTGWWTFPSLAPVTEPLSVTISDFDVSYGGYSLDELAVFFEGVGGGTKTVLSVTDTNDEGIVKAYEVYADEVIVDTVPKAETIDATALGVTAGASVTVKAKSIIDTTSEASNAVVFA